MKELNKFKQFDIWLISLDPTIGSEIKKTRPCVKISPNEINYLRTVIVAPLTTHGFSAPTRVGCKFAGKESFVLLDQIRSVDKKRLIKSLGRMHYTTCNSISQILIEMFSI